jgi:hypothetical protein
MSAVRVIGIRHHSPACARLVAHAIAHDKPQAILIEGPSDFNARMGEMLLDHELPLALYSYANEGERSAQCWFPFVAYSPEWVALRAGHAAGATVRFMDLPHWHYRTLPDAERRVGAGVPGQSSGSLPDMAPGLTPGMRPGGSRYAEVTARLCQRFACDSDDALWDHLFESEPAPAPQTPFEGVDHLESMDRTEPASPTALAALDARLALYFAELRGDDPGSEQDRARERHMAQWTAWAAAHHRSVLVVCGGWHKPAIERDWSRLNGSAEPHVPQPLNERAAGSYLVPYAWRQVDALGGYGAGMPSPMFYQWAWQRGQAKASAQAAAKMVSRLRRQQVPVSTADLVAFEQTTAALARLRGHAHPLRVDLLDALQSAVVKEALDSPPPWAGARLLRASHHPVLREALLALTGEGAGRLHADTPLPPLLHDVQARLLACALVVSPQAQTIVLDRRRPADTARAHLLWQLHGLGVSGVKLDAMKAPRAARGLSADLAFEEHWRLQQGERWYPDLIEAAVYGATLASAARQRLLQQVAEAGANAPALTRCLMQAIRAGMLDIGEDVAQALQRGLPQCHDHGALAHAAQALSQVVQAGFWGDDPRGLLQATLVMLAERLLWLLEGRDGPGSAAQLQADVSAVAVFDRLLNLNLAGLDAAFALATLARLARSPAKPPALRGAALGVAHGHQGLAGEDTAAARHEVMALTRAMPPRDALGDFLYGLFSCARALATESDDIAQAVHGALLAMGDEDFLVALPALRGAFGWFPPRERGALAAHVARLLGLSAGGPSQLLQLPGGVQGLIDARRIEAQALAWARELGLSA